MMGVSLKGSRTQVLLLFLNAQLTGFEERSLLARGYVRCKTFGVFALSSNPKGFYIKVISKNTFSGGVFNIPRFKKIFISGNI